MGDYSMLERLQDGEEINLEEFTSKYDDVTKLIIENGGSGSAVAAPIAHKILNFAYQENV